MNDDEYTIESGFLGVGNGHKIYYQRWGNKKAAPIFSLHGGPGSGTRDAHKLAFDPKVHQVIFHDQRGCGNSKPFGKLEHNTTQDLIEDIEKLRKKFKFSKIRLFGMSWGSCLGLAYAVEHPDKVEKMLLGGIYTGTKEENDHIQQGGNAAFYPETWNEYIEAVPEEYRGDTTAYYFEKMNGRNKKVAEDYIRRWNNNEAAAMSIDPDIKQTIFNNLEVDDKARSVALLEAHYFNHNCFMRDRYIFNNVTKLKSIPIILVQGRHDHVCPPVTAFNLAKALGVNCHLHITPGAHAREGAFREVTKAYMWSFLS